MGSPGRGSTALHLCSRTRGNGAGAELREGAGFPGTSMSGGWGGINLCPPCALLALTHAVTFWLGAGGQRPLSLK